MGRRVSNGVVGSSGTIGQLSVTGNTLTTTQSNTNLIIDPQGSGQTQFVGNVQVNAQGELRLADADSSNYIALRATTTVGTNRTLTFPDSVGSAGQVLQTDGNNPATLSWVAQTTAGVGISDPGSVSSPTFYPYFGSSTSGNITGLSYRGNLTYEPSSGTLTSLIGSHANLIGGAGSSGTLTIRATTSATKPTAGILMTENIASSSISTGTLVIGVTGSPTAGGLGVQGNIYAGGTVSCAALTATTITETSSIELKENLDPITDALEKIMKLQAYIYDRKDGSSMREPGLIKEEVETIIPNLTNEDGILYTKLTAYLVEAVKSLKQEINALKGA